MLKRITSGITAFLLSISSLLVFAPGLSFAATHTWDGSAGDHKFSTAANWSGDVVPSSGDSIVLPYSASHSSDDELIQDIEGLSLNTITVSGDSGSNCDGQYKRFNISGDALSLTGGIDASDTAGDCWGSIKITVENLTLTASTFSINNEESATDLYLGNYITNSSIVMGSTNLTKLGNRVTIDGKIKGSGSMTIGGDMTLNADNSEYTGSINVNSGILSGLSGSSLGDGSSAVVIGDGASLRIATGGSEDFVISRPITLSGASFSGRSKLDFGSNKSSCTGNHNLKFTGTFTLNNDATYSGSCEGKLTIEKPVLGGNSFTAGENNSATLVIGDKEVSPEWTETEISDDKPEEFLLINGYSVVILNGVRGEVHLMNNGILKGNGRITGDLNALSGSIVAPGLSPGCLIVGEGMNLAGEYQFELKGTDACSGHDQIKVTGSVVLGSGSENGTLKVSFLEDYNPSAGSKFIIIDNEGTDEVSGTFKDLAEGATFEGPNKSVFKISYKGGDGNDVELTVITAGTPDTGFGMLLNNPAITAGLATLAGGAILVMARRMKLVAKSSRR